MLTKDKIEQFYNDVETLGLKHPVAEIHRRTGISKGQVSQVLSRKLSPSEDFIAKFYNGFKKVSNGTSQNNDASNYTLSTNGINITLQDYINLLHRENDRLFTIINSSLGKIYRSQQSAIAWQKAWVDYEAERASGGDPKKKKEIQYKMSKLVDGILQNDSTEDIHGETDI